MGYPTGTRVLQDPSPQRAGLFACHAQAGIRIVYERLVHTDVSTTMIYTHVLNRAWRGVRSPADRLPDPAAHIALWILADAPNRPR